MDFFGWSDGNFDAVVKTAGGGAAALRRERRRQVTISSVESGDTNTQLDTIFRILSALELELVGRRRTKDVPDDFLKLFK